MGAKGGNLLGKGILPKELTLSYPDSMVFPTWGSRNLAGLETALTIFAYCCEIFRFSFFCKTFKSYAIHSNCCSKIVLNGCPGVSRSSFSCLVRSQAETLPMLQPCWTAAQLAADGHPTHEIRHI